LTNRRDIETPTVRDSRQAYTADDYLSYRLYSRNYCPFLFTVN
jgi:hypothetical protein